MPSRVIRHEFTRSHSLMQVSRDARLTMALLILAVDDYGRMEASPAHLKADLFPLDDDVSTQMIESWIAELASRGCVEWYSLPNEPKYTKPRRYLHLPQWETYFSKRRKIDSKLPAPPPDAFPKVSEMKRTASETRHDGVGGKELESEKEQETEMGGGPGEGPPEASPTGLHESGQGCSHGDVVSSPHLHRCCLCSSVCCEVCRYSHDCAPPELHASSSHPEPDSVPDLRFDSCGGCVTPDQCSDATRCLADVDEPVEPDPEECHRGTPGCVGGRNHLGPCPLDVRAAPAQSEPLAVSPSEPQGWQPCTIDSRCDKVSQHVPPCGQLNFAGGWDSLPSEPPPSEDPAGENNDFCPPDCDCDVCLAKALHAPAQPSLPLEPATGETELRIWDDLTAYDCPEHFPNPCDCREPAERECLPGCVLDHSAHGKICARWDVKHWVAIEPLIDFDPADHQAYVAEVEAAHSARVCPPPDANATSRDCREESLRRNLPVCTGPCQEPARCGASGVCMVPEPVTSPHPDAPGEGCTEPCKPGCTLTPGHLELCDVPKRPRKRAKPAPPPEWALEAAKRLYGERPKCHPECERLPGHLQASQPCAVHMAGIGNWKSLRAQPTGTGLSRLRKLQGSVTTFARAFAAWREPPLPEELSSVIDWLCGQGDWQDKGNPAREDCQFVIWSVRSFKAKWDNLLSAMERELAEKPAEIDYRREAMAESE